jgi:hypothetical protein
LQAIAAVECCDTCAFCEHTNRVHGLSTFTSSNSKASPYMNIE